jgi:phage terminase large subunit-like protein
MVDFSNFDITTQRNLEALKELLNYKPNNSKMLAFHKSTAKTRLLLGGKRSGKSLASVVETCWAALGIHPYLSYPEPPLKIRYCGVDFTNGIKGIVLPLFRRFLGSFDNGPVVRRYWAEDRILELKNETTVQMSSYDQDLEKFEGVSRDLIVMDEEPPLDVYQSNFMRTIDCGGKLIIACTPIQGLTWLYYNLYDNPDAVPPAVEYWHVKTSENPHISPEEIEAVKRDPAMRDNLETALGGEFIPRSNLVFPAFVDESILPTIKKPTMDDMILVGIDPHDRNPWGVVFVILNRENKYIVYDEILQAGTVDEIAPLIKEKLGHRRANLAVIDTSANATQATSGKSIKDQLLTPHGIYCTDADKDISSGILTINSALKNKTLLISPNCVHIKRQFRSCIWDDWARNRNQRDPKERILKRDDHLLDALRYVMMLPVVYRHPNFSISPKTPERHNRVTGYF